ncbi:cytochrome b/b6 domain-containing protein [Ramlibacter humi]|uniref:Cytochrome B n=1 Tax=Ramlibacter humi TaxID=2530451 RepID=A0A4Z0CCI9_9BURK|nr:cytochrome b/b6 domain-containing protein [Ramlibacter humi]TFZ08632.1 cytochrome B [Ramlibacter humi]
MTATPAGATRVWDRAVRCIHWSLAATCAAAWITTAIGMRWHEPLGYVALALVALRIVWGFAGGRYARFSQFVRSPRATWAYAVQVARGAAPRYLGHNPLGGWMALTLWGCIALLGFTGWLYTTDAFWGEAWLDRTHQVLGWSTLALVVLHLAGVALTARQHREKLVKAMLSGEKPAAGPGDVA